MRPITVRSLSLTIVALVLAAAPAAAQFNLNPTALQIAEAMDIPLASIQSAEFVQIRNDMQKAVSSQWGNQLVPLQGPTLAALSNGRARTPVMPSWTQPAAGTVWTNTPSVAPMPLPSHPNCPTPNSVYDAVELRFEISVPAGAGGFTFDHNFLSIDYPNYACTTFSDGFLAVVESPLQGIQNVALDALGNAITLNTALFRAGVGTELGTAPLSGTGYDAGSSGGATMWNTAVVNAIPGETVTLRLFIYDGNDAAFDSLVLLDNFQWLAGPANDPPVANAGADFTVTGYGPFAQATLNGSGSSDPEGQPLTYTWTGAFGTASGVAPTVTLPAGINVVTLTVADTLGGTASDTVTVTVIDAIATAVTTVAAHDVSIAALQAQVAALQAQVQALQQTVATMLKHPIWNSLPNAGPKK
jgi:hypothetical protein